MCVHARPGFVHGHCLPQTHTCADDDGGGGGGLAVVFLCACAYQLQGCHPVADVCVQICQPHARVHGTRCVARNRIHGEKGRLSTITEREREKVCVCLCVCLCLSVCLCVCVCVSVCFSLTYTHSLPPSPLVPWHQMWRAKTSACRTFFGRWKTWRCSCQTTRTLARAHYSRLRLTHCFPDCYVVLC